MKHLAYIRVSTDKQDEQSQRQTIDEWCKKQNLSIAMTHSDTESGSTPWQKRIIAATLDLADRGDTIVVSEISRIARSILGVLSFLEAAAERGVCVVAIRSGITLDQSMSSKITVTILALAAEIERDLIRERTKAALQARKAAGQKLGRPAGSKSESSLTSKSADIDRMLTAKISKRAIARVLNCAPGTLYAYLATRSEKAVN